MLEKIGNRLQKKKECWGVAIFYGNIRIFASSSREMQPFNNLRMTRNKSHITQNLLGRRNAACQNPYNLGIYPLQKLNAMKERGEKKN
jgi:hypothetical protein